jgi:hypothetical protein
LKLIEDLAVEAATSEAGTTLDLTRQYTYADILEMFQRMGRASITPRRMEKCPICAGRGVARAKLGVVWGYTCWVCGGWGAVDERWQNWTFAGPIAPHPFRNVT